jgi:ribosomal protein S18 acetylase RimI-like enzyme
MRRKPAPPIVTRPARPEDAALLAELGASTFLETYESANTSENLAAYTAAAFGEAIQREELEDPDATVFFAEREGDVVGYVMLRERTPPASLGLDDALEIARFYARQRAVGIGVGAALMQRAIAEAAGRGKDAVWLAVWSRNERAIRFYESWGFHRSGTQPFLLGTDLQTDLVMVRRLARES